MQLLSVNNDAKTSKGVAKGYLTGILYLAPSNIANRKMDLCPHATKECRAACLYKAGRGQFTSVQEARIRKTRMFLSDRKMFLRELDCDLRSLVRKANKLGLCPCVRLNGTSDIDWEVGLPLIFRLFPEIQFYDYTKSPSRMIHYLDGGMPTNYYLTFSHSGENLSQCKEVLDEGGTVCVVFKGGLPEKWNGYPVVDGDGSDLRFLDPSGHVIGLKAKGKARKLPVGGFVQQGIV